MLTIITLTAKLKPLWKVSAETRIIGAVVTKLFASRFHLVAVTFSRWFAILMFASIMRKVNQRIVLLYMRPHTDRGTYHSLCTFRASSKKDGLELALPTRTREKRPLHVHRHSAAFIEARLQRTQNTACRQLQLMINVATTIVDRR